MTISSSVSEQTTAQDELKYLAISVWPSSASQETDYRVSMPAHEPRRLHSEHGLQIRPRHVIVGLVILRLVNALCTGRTFFQPDEYFQALEPAWNLAFGPDSGAWLTWVRRS